MAVTSSSGVYQVLDGGWGWVCVAACAFNVSLFRGVNVSFSILYESLRLKYNSSAASTSWVYSIGGMMTCFMAIFVSLLCQKFGCRAVGMVGGVLYGGGMVLTAYCTSISQVYVTFGVFVGSASCSILITTPMVINQYFDKHRAKAMAVTYLGVSAGTVVFANLIGGVITELGLNPCLIVLACIALHQTVASCLCRPPPLHRVKAITFEIEALAEKNPDPVIDVKLNTSMESCLRRYEQNEHSSEHDFFRHSSPDLYYRDAGASNSENITMHHFPTQTLHKVDQSSNNESKHSFQSYCDTSLIKSRQYLSFVAMDMFFGTSAHILDPVLAGIALERNISIREVSWIISIATIMEVVARISTGVCFDLQRVRSLRVYIYGLCTLCGSLCNLLFPLTNGVVSLSVLFSMTRFLTCIYFTQGSVILSDLVTPSQFPGALGTLQFMRGFALLGPFFAGVIKDKYGSFDLALYITGSIGIMGSIMFLAVVKTQACFKSRKNDL